jgi:hypothetical protein
MCPTSARLCVCVCVLNYILLVHTPHYSVYTFWVLLLQSVPIAMYNNNMWIQQMYAERDRLEISGLIFVTSDVFRRN